MHRRQFLAAGVALAAAPLLPAAAPKPRLRIACKYGMISVKGSVLDHFKLAKECGFEGVEIDSPGGLNLREAVDAARQTGVVIHGVIDSVHWGKPLSSPDAAVRAEGLTALTGAIKDAKTVGADTVLLVPAVARNGVSYEQAYERSQAEIKKAVPLAEELGVKIAIETVWNDFITKPEQMVQFVDEFRTPAVAAYFDLSNMLRYGVPSETWIRTLGKRLVKFDFKGYSLEVAAEKRNPGAGFNVKIGEGSENWPAILTALGEIGYDGWATSEVGGGGKEHLTDVARRMRKVLELG